MTHTLHRQGAPETFDNDFILLAMPAKGYNTPGSREKLVQIVDICVKHHCANIGDTQQGNMYSIGVENLKKRIKDGGVLNALFNTREDLIAALKEVKEANTGMSVVVTGLFEHTKGCCKQADLPRHTIASAVGIFGKTHLLPDPDHLSIMTMCGHAMVTSAHIDHLVSEIKAGRMTLEEGGKELAKPCVCGIINPARTSEILENFL
jgi:hypothetical protein